MESRTGCVTNPKLSIVIPTMDRQALLVETLCTIAPQLSVEVELVVLDSSKDSQPVRMMVEKAGGRYFWQKPRGFDQAFLDVVNLALGEFVWLLGDDDLLKPQAVQKVLRLLDAPPLAIAEPLDLLVVNADVVGEDSSRILKEQWLNLPETEFGASQRSEVVAKLGGLMTFPGSMVVRKSFWSQGAAVAGDYVGKRFITVVVPLLLPARRVRFSPMVLASARYGHQSWMDSSSTLIGKTMIDVVWSLPGVEDYAKQALSPRPPTWPQLLLWRACGQSFGSLPYFRARLVGALPVQIVRCFCRTVVRLSGKSDSMTGYTLGLSS